MFRRGGLSRRAEGQSEVVAVLSKQKGVRPKHAPLRTCVVCRETNAKRTLTRLVRTEADGVQVDPTGKRNGRGAYLCDKPSCWERALDSDVLAKALRTEITDADRQRVREAMQTHTTYPSM